MPLLRYFLYVGGALLSLILIANLANVSLFSAAIPGPEELLAGRPLLVVSLVLFQIVVTLILVGILAARREASVAP